MESTSSVSTNVPVVSTLPTKMDFKPSTSANTPTLPAVVMLSGNAKATAHLGDRWKAGYITLSRVAQNKSGWRNVHISKRSFEKFVEHLTSFEEAMQNKTKY